MNHNLEYVTYTFATVAGICFIGGLIILSGGGK